MKRKSISTARRERIFDAAGGLCHICGGKISGKAWDVEHIRALGLLGEDDDANMAPAHKACHAPKTKDDTARIAKAKRQRARHIGIKKRSWQSKWKRKVDGTTVLR
jgi:5-methylcytosine-specific restriction endonuclease McrA